MKSPPLAESLDLPKELPTPPVGWTRCHFYVERKRRFCRQTVVDAPENHGGPRYCGNHSHLYGVPSKRKRVPCPIDGSHSIYEDTVAKHVLVCPRVKRRKTQEQEPHYRYNINTGGYGDMAEHTGDRELSVEWAKQLALSILQAYQRVFDPKNAATSQSLTFQDIQKAISLMDLSEPELAAGLAESVEVHRIRSGGHRHLVQQASLIGHLRRIGVLPGLGASETANTRKAGKTCFLELGAGRGMLGLVAAGAAAASHVSPETHLVLVERAGTRGKADTVLRTAKGLASEESAKYLRLHELQWTRIQCDLAHVHMQTVLTSLDPSKQTDEVADELPVSAKEDDLGPGIQAEDSQSQCLVVVAKHLCGAGTDIALRSLREISSQVDACVMATCCHGICTWNDYVGRDSLRRLLEADDDAIPFGKQEFEMMRRWTSGTVAVPENRACLKDGNQGSVQEGDKEFDADHCATEPEDVKDSYSVSSIVQAAGLSCGVQGLGRACQRLIDFGRCDYMRLVLFGEDSSVSELFHYVSKEITPQNAVLVAYRKR